MIELCIEMSSKRGKAWDWQGKSARGLASQLQPGHHTAAFALVFQVAKWLGARM